MTYFCQEAKLLTLSPAPHPGVWCEGPLRHRSVFCSQQAEESGKGGARAGPRRCEWISHQLALRYSAEASL